MLEMVIGRRGEFRTAFSFDFGLVMVAVVVRVDLLLLVTFGMIFCLIAFFFVVPFVVILFKVCVICRLDII